MSKPRPISPLSLATKQRVAVMERADWQCEFERAVVGLPVGETHHEGQRIVEWAQTEDLDGKVTQVAWVPCGDGTGLQTCHIFRRHKCGDHETDDGWPLKFHPAVAIAGCARHHRQFDNRLHQHSVRVPAVQIETARRLIIHTEQQARERGERVEPADLSHT